MDLKRSKMAVQEFQDYLESLGTSKGTLPAERARDLLFSYAEVQFRLHGGWKCAACSSTVRHVVRVEIEGRDGAVKTYKCLCTRCLEGERPLARRIVLSLGELELEIAPTLTIKRAPADWPKHRESAASENIAHRKQRPATARAASK